MKKKKKEYWDELGELNILGELGELCGLDELDELECPQDSEYTHMDLLNCFFKVFCTFRQHLNFEIYET